MKKLVACLALAAVLVPATSALADIPQPAGADPCPPGFTGAIVWHLDPIERDYEYYYLCFH